MGVEEASCLNLESTQEWNPSCRKYKTATIATAPKIKNIKVNPTANPALFSLWCPPVVVVVVVTGVPEEEVVEGPIVDDVTDDVALIDVAIGLKIVDDVAVVVPVVGEEVVVVVVVVG